MKINKIISAILSAAVIITSGASLRLPTADAAQTCTVTFLDFNGNVMLTQTVEAGGNIDFSSIDTSILHDHIDSYTEREFYCWSYAPLTITSDTTIQALWRTASISLESAPSRHRIFAADKSYPTDGMKVLITIAHQLPEFTIEGEYKTVSTQTDVSASCKFSPPTPEAAFINGNKASVKIYPINSTQAIGEFEVYDYRWLGDVNSSGIVDAVDASAVLTKYVNMAANKDYSINSEFMRRADVNFDGVIDSRDASAILRYYTFSSDSDMSFEDIIDFKDLP